MRIDPASIPGIAVADDHGDTELTNNTDKDFHFASFWEAPSNFNSFTLSPNQAHTYWLGENPICWFVFGAVNEKIGGEYLFAKMDQAYQAAANFVKEMELCE